MNISPAFYPNPLRLSFSKNKNKPYFDPDKPAGYTDEEWEEYNKQRDEISKNSRANMECRRHKGQRTFDQRDPNDGFFPDLGYEGIDE